MDNMRFGQPNRPQEISSVLSSSKKPRHKFFSKILFLVLIIILGLIFAGFYIYSKTNDIVFDRTASPYYAVFLTNGQVYFGKPMSKNKTEFVISDVYYLQLSGESTTPSTQKQLAEPKFKLVKLGEEIHGPVDTLFINRSNILFYEQLRKDSKVVQSITK